uniref:WGS project CBMI000000000 data, contig CS3069_c003890 n=1 Tax=Fusarium clavum TaxID=2594811 RepID=A0A090MEA3_9HYPO|nr:unnamed protein product [Fusarium clavum]
MPSEGISILVLLQRPSVPYETDHFFLSLDAPLSGARFNEVKNMPAYYAHGRHGYCERFKA